MCQEFPLQINEGNTNSYFETTARYNPNVETSTKDGILNNGPAIVTFRPDVTATVVINGGGRFSMQMFYSGDKNAPDTTLRWFVGRNANMDTVTCGTTVAYETQYHTVKINIDLAVTGGRVSNIYGASNGFNSICVGKRNIRIYGNNGKSTRQYDPSITNLYGGANAARFFGDVEIDLSCADNVTDLYGGGNNFTATTYGNITINLNNNRSTLNNF